MRGIKIYIAVIMFWIVLIVCATTSNGANLSVSASKSTASNGDKVKITVNGDGITGWVTLSANGGVLSSDGVWVENSSNSVYLTVSGDKNIVVKANPSSVADSNTAAPYSEPSYVTIKVSNNSKKDEQKSNTKTDSTKKDENKNETEEKTKSKVATLKNLGITPKQYDFSAFKPGTTSYSVKVPNDVESVKIYATATSAKAKISGVGTKKLKEGVNTFNVKVTAEDEKTTKTYTLTINRSKEKEEDKDKEKEEEEKEKEKTEDKKAEDSKTKSSKKSKKSK